MIHDAPAPRGQKRTPGSRPSLAEEPAPGGNDVALGAIAGQIADQQRQLRKVGAQLDALTEELRRRAAVPAVAARPAVDPEHARISTELERTLKALQHSGARISRLEDSMWLTRILGIMGPLAALLIGLAF